MKKLSLFQSLYDDALYFNSQGTYFAVYIDDLLIVGLDIPLISKLKTQLASKFKTTELDLNAHYLKIEVSQEDKAITVTQTI